MVEVGAEECTKQQSSRTTRTQVGDPPPVRACARRRRHACSCTAVIAAAFRPHARRESSDAEDDGGDELHGLNFDDRYRGDGWCRIAIVWGNDELYRRRLARGIRGRCTADWEGGRARRNADCGVEDPNLGFLQRMRDSCAICCSAVCRDSRVHTSEEMEMKRPWDLGHVHYKQASIRVVVCRRDGG